VSLRRNQLNPINKAVNKKEQLGKGLVGEEEKSFKEIVFLVKPLFFGTYLESWRS
jgi:hypothetical protein